MENIYLILTILGIHLLAVISPGPDFVVAVRNSVSFGRRIGIFTAIGFGLGICVHLLYCYFGVAILISQLPKLFSFIKILGAIYLLYISYQIFKNRNSFSPDNLDEDRKLNLNTMSDMGAIKSGFFTNALNPKATLFFLGLFSVAIPQNINSFSFLLICFFLAFDTFLWFTLVSFIFTKKKSLKVFTKYAVYINTILALTLFLLSIKILFLI